MAKKLTLEDIERQQKKYKEELARLGKESRRLKAQERAAREKAERAEEQAKALEFYRVCKTMKANEYQTIYEHVMNRLAKDNG